MEAASEGMEAASEGMEAASEGKEAGLGMEAGLVDTPHTSHTPHTPHTSHTLCMADRLLAVALVDMTVWLGAMPLQAAVQLYMGEV